jgi:hypothetical protein
VSYSTRDDVFTFGLAAMAFVARPRPAEAVDISTATVRIKAHGLSTLDVITFEVTSGGSLPTSISAARVYCPLPASFDLFRISLTQGGAAISSWASAGSGWGIAVDPSRMLDAQNEAQAAIIDEHLTAHAPPIQVDPITGLYPMVLRVVNARLTARAAIRSRIFDNPAYRECVDSLMATEEQDWEMLDRWIKGKPIQPRPVDQDAIANIAPITSAGVAVDWVTGAM